MTIQCDEQESFVGNKNNKQWVWLALDVNSGEIVGIFVGDRGSCWSYGIMAIVTWGISARGLLHRFLGGI
ncbi:MAG TPA: IS1 family transposase [Leptolyngbyaceae cyanobacterium]